MARLGDTRKRARSAGTGTTGAERRNVRRVLRFRRTTDRITPFSLIFPYHDPVPPYHTQIHWTASFISPISLSPHLRSTLALSSGALLIPLSEQWLLSCTIHRPTKRWYCRLRTTSPSLSYPYSLRLVLQYIRMYS